MRLEEGDLLFIPFTLGTLPLKSKFEDALKIIAGTLSKFTSMFIGKEPPRTISKTSCEGETKGISIRGHRCAVVRVALSFCVLVESYF